MKKIDALFVTWRELYSKKKVFLSLTINYMNTIYGIMCTIWFISIKKTLSIAMEQNHM